MIIYLEFVCECQVFVKKGCRSCNKQDFTHFLDFFGSVLNLVKDLIVAEQDVNRFLRSIDGFQTVIDGFLPFIDGLLTVIDGKKALIDGCVPAKIQTKHLLPKQQQIHASKKLPTLPTSRIGSLSNNKPNNYSPRLPILARMNSRNNGCGRFGRDTNSGWN